MPGRRTRAARIVPAGQRTLEQIVAKNLRDWRRLRGLSQSTVTARLGALGFDWAQATISEIERGGRTVTLDELAALALALFVNPLDLLDPFGAEEIEREPLYVGAHLHPLPGVAARHWLRGRARFGVSGDETTIMANSLKYEPVPGAEDAGNEAWRAYNALAIAEMRREQAERDEATKAKPPKRGGKRRRNAR